MAGRKTRLISAPAARGNSANGSWSQVAGSMGAMTGEGPTAVTSERFETPQADDDHWERTIAQREAAEGLPAVEPTIAYQLSPQWNAPQAQVQSQPPRADLACLPDRFALEIERKNGRWKITASGVHTGLWKSGHDLPDTVHEALVALAEMVRIDGVVAKRRRRT